MPHSPLPEEPPPTLELMNAKLTHLITVTEVVRDRVDSWDRRVEEVHAAKRALQSIAQRLSRAALELAFARIVQRLPSPWMAAATVTAAFLGGLAGTVAWQWLHAGAALAAP